MLAVHHHDTDGLAVRRGWERERADNEANEFSNQTLSPVAWGRDLLTVLAFRVSFQGNHNDSLLIAFEFKVTRQPQLEGGKKGLILCVTCIDVLL